MNVQPQNRRQSFDPSWRKARIAARILLRSQSGKLTGRDRRLAPRLARDPAVTERLIDQAVASIIAWNKIRACAL